MIAAFLAATLIPKPEVSAWVVGYNEASVKRFEERASQFNTIFMEYYTVTADGLPTRRNQYDKAFTKAKSAAKKHGVEFYGMINNYANEGIEDFDPKRMTKALLTAESRATLATNLVKMLKQDGAQGVDLDFESLKGDDRDRYSAFVAALAKLLHKEGMNLSVTVHPKQEPVGGWDGTKSQDYKALGAVADRFNIMTYDFSWSTSPAGPIAPNDWVERVIKFASSQVDPSKIGMGIACYGYDWNKNPATSLAFDEFDPKNATPDPKSGELVEGKKHFSGAEAFRQKYQLATKLGIKSIAFWYCGSEDPKVWNLLPTRR
jgi:spore germination protein YaaH